MGKRLGFSIVQVAHRIETLTRSDVLYFIEHGRVVEAGGLTSLNGQAVDELSAVDIEYTKVSNPETGKEEERLKKGFYRQLHEAYYNLDFHNMELSQLVKQVGSPASVAVATCDLRTCKLFEDEALYRQK